ncbi:MAG TPA: TIGR03960 family B12-binding radical SAM protein [Candidatus Aminicenantes bacterium]|nr:TIGR03960 family B12-binding radical SAM protein [Candidatus Aminicenantes bacterium]
MNADRRQLLLRRLRNPQAWMGLEINAVCKQPVPGDINICLVFPDTYEIGMSHQGIKILYHLLNARNGVVAARCFLPEPESAHLFGEMDIPLFSIEQQRNLMDFDVVGFSLLTEFSFSGVLHVLDLARLPLKSRDRDSHHPLIVAGGISVVNPEPLREFVDIFAVGDGEILFPEITDVLRESRRPGEKKSALLARLSRIPGVYVPSRTETTLQGRFMLPASSDGGITRRCLKNLDEVVAEEKMIVPLGRTVFDRLEVEIARGCPQACRFCQARSYYAPWRQRAIPTLAKYLSSSLRCTGFEAFSLSSLSAGDYADLQSLLRNIVNHVPEGVFMSVPSLRPATLSRELLQTIASYRRTGITIVPEAGSERLRGVINKSVTDAEIMAAVDSALDLGWRKLKLYFMIGLPTETEADIDAAADLVEAILQRCRGRHVRLHVSFSAFVPKPHTPLQWTRRESAHVLLQRIQRLKQRLKRYRNLVMDFSDPRLGEVETILSRGDARVGELLLRVYRDGERYSAWAGHFNAATWERHIRDLGLEIFLEDIPVSQPLPWEHIQVDFRPEHLLAEYRRAMVAEPSPSCRERDCADCRGCYHPMPAYRQDSCTAAVPEPESLPQPVFRPVRLFYAKQEKYRYLSQLTLNQLMERLIRRTGMRFRSTSGFHPRMKMVALPPLPVLATGLEEVVEVFLDACWSAETILDKLLWDSHFPWIRAQVPPAASRGLSRSLEAMVYRIFVDDPGNAVALVEPLLEAGDQVTLGADLVEVQVGSRGDGAARFARIYRSLDPQKQRLEDLVRVRVVLADPDGSGDTP